MNMKPFLMLIASGLVLASVAYTAPAMADDTSNSNQSAQQAPTDNNAQNQDNIGSSTDSGTNNSTNTDNSSTDSSSSNSSTGADGGSPDTATGDDDY